MRVGSLFSGIGGLDLGLERAGMRVVWQAESDPYCRAVLRKHWPDVPCYEDVRDITADAPAVDLICGGFPCQPVSQAGARRGRADERWLWPEFARIVRLLRPRYVLVENVPGLLLPYEYPRGSGVWWSAPVEEVLGDLVEGGYDAEWDGIPAAAVGAPHLRDRVWLLAYTDGERRLHGETAGRPAETREPSQRHASSGRPDGAVRRAPRFLSALADSAAFGLEGSQNTNGLHRSSGAERAGEPTGSSSGARTFSNTAGARLEGRSEPTTPQGTLTVAPCGGRRWPAEPDVGRVADGVPSWVDRVKCLGNAVVPQVAEWIGRQIMTYESLTSVDPKGTDR